MSFIVQATSFSLLNAIKTEAEKLGWHYESAHNPFTEEAWETGSSFRRLEFGYGYRGSGLKDIILTRAFPSTVDSYSLPQDWDKVLIRLKETISIALNSACIAAVADNKIIVAEQVFEFKALARLHAAMHVQDKPFAVHSESFPLLNAIKEVADKNDWKFTTKPWGHDFSARSWDYACVRKRRLYFQNGEYNLNNSSTSGVGAYATNVQIYILPQDWDIVVEKLCNEIKLNSQYTAKIKDNKVTVGCQVFTFDAIEKLYQAVFPNHE
jgi:hypothetical protein